MEGALKFLGSTVPPSGKHDPEPPVTMRDNAVVFDDPEADGGPELTTAVEVVCDSHTCLALAPASTTEKKMRKSMTSGKYRAD